MFKPRIRRLIIRVYYIWLIQTLFEYNIYFLFLAFLINIIIWYGSKIYNFQKLIKNYSSILAVRFILVSSLCLSTIFVFILTYFYFIYIRELNLVSSLDINKYKCFYLDYYKIYIFNNLFFKFYLDGFGLVILNLAYMVGIISLLSLDTRYYWKNIRFIFLCNLIILFVLFFVISNDILSFFLFYEALLIPSFILVYYVSPTRRSIQAALYFLIWTQFGSLLVLCACLYIFNTSGLIYFDDLKNFNFTVNEIYLLYALLFFGFGFKVPIWPFHHWLTKTHVEAPAGFSIFLSGFLVKSAVYGFYKLSNLLGGEIDTTFFSIFAFLGALDASLKMWAQTDLKKLVAYGTIQEMSLIYLVLTWGDTFAIYGSLIFCITHAFLSSLLFFLVDCIQRRYKTRMITELNGVLHTTPNLGIVILVVCLVYSGLPGTVKFITEFYIFSGLVEAAPYTVIFLIFIVNYLGIIGFCKCWYNLVFGMNPKQQGKNPMDLNFKEIFVIVFSFICFFFFGFIVNLIL